MRLEALVTHDKPVRLGAWWSKDDGKRRYIYHYDTCMMEFIFTTDAAGNCIPFYLEHFDIGHGSKSDQDGMNRLFRALGVNYYYSRSNRNPRIELRN